MNDQNLISVNFIKSIIEVLKNFRTGLYGIKETYKKWNEYPVCLEGIKFEIDKLEEVIQQVNKNLSEYEEDDSKTLSPESTEANLKLLESVLDSSLYAVKILIAYSGLAETNPEVKALLQRSKNN